MSRYIDADEPIKQIVHDAIDNTQMAEDVFVGIKEKLHKAVDEFNSDYIKREDAIKAMAQYLMDMALIDNPEASDHIEQWEGSIAAPVMSTIKAADVVEVVRCKDCKHRYYDRERDFYYCRMYYGMGDTSDNNYCSLGERTDE